MKKAIAPFGTNFSEFSGDCIIRIFVLGMVTEYLQSQPSNCLEIIVRIWGKYVFLRSLRI